MKNATRLSFLTFVLAGLTFLLSGYDFTNLTHSQHPVECDASCTDNANELVDSHTISLEDDFFITTVNLKLSGIRSSLLFLSHTIKNPQNNFPNSIWQPPKQA